MNHPRRVLRCSRPWSAEGPRTPGLTAASATGSLFRLSFYQDSTIVRFVHRFVLASIFVVAACGDDLGPTPWLDVPDTLTIYSVSRPELLGLPSAFDGIFFPPDVVIESGAPWDFALAEQDGEFVMLPVSSIPGNDTTAAIVTTSASTLEELIQAPPDADFTTESVPIQPGTIYALRTRRSACSQFTNLTGPRFGKLEAIALDPEAGTFVFAFVVNPVCNDRALVPPND